MELNFNIEEIAKLPLSEQREILRILQQHEEKASLAAARTSFMGYVHRMWPQFIEGRHHREMGKIYDAVTRKELLRVCIHLPPRHTKSEFASWNFPAQYFGHHPNHKIMQISNTGELASGFGRRVRDSMESPEYAEIFEEVTVKADSRSAGRWNTNRGGDYFATGVGGAIAGRGADALIIDDPHCLELDTEIPTTRGFVKMRDLKVGDQVFGPDGAPTYVIAKSVVFEKELYRVTTDDGSELLCDDDHLWSLKSHAMGKFRLHRAKELVGRRMFLPRQQPVQYPHRKLPIDPWVLGAWLGDGTSSLGRMTCHPDDSVYMRAGFETAGYKTTTLADPYSFGVLKLRSALIRNNLLNNKHIPEEYFTSSIAQRKRLVQGLMDTDGCVSEDGSCAFDNQNKVLVEGMIELLRSLGVKAKLWERSENNRYGADPVQTYRVVFRMKDAALMPRKRVRTRETRRWARHISVERTGVTGRVQCIKVARDDGLFLAGRGYVVTHNTEAEAQAAIYNPKVYDDAYEWYRVGPRQRLQPNGAIIIVMTRWAKRDLAGQVINHAIEQGAIDEWKIFNFPAIMPSGNALWPEFWSKEELEKIKRDIPLYRWLSQYQQQPTTDEGAIIKREYWKPWERDRLPEFAYILDSWDTAFTAKETGNYSARTRWGVFYFPDSNGRPLANVMLIDSWRDRLEFPALKTQVREDYRDGHPDTMLIEARGSGISLIQELSSMGMPIEQVTTGRLGNGISNDKVARANAVVDIFKSGIVWYNPSCKLNEVTIEECSDLPRGDNDDLADTTTQALKRLRDGYFVGTQHDDYQIYDEDDEPARPRGRIY